MIIVLQAMYNNGGIVDDQNGYLKPGNVMSGRLHLLPTVRKVNIPGRPNVFANGNPTSKISEFEGFNFKM